MKTLKSKIAAGLSALVLLFGAIYIVEAMEKGETSEVKVLTEEWFIFNSPLNPGDTGYQAALQDPNNYSPTHSSTPPTVCDEGNQKVCAVKAIPSSGDTDQPDPDELENLLPEMTSPTPDSDIVRLKPLDEN